MYVVGELGIEIEDEDGGGSGVRLVGRRGEGDAAGSSWIC